MKNEPNFKVNDLDMIKLLLVVIILSAIFGAVTGCCTKSTYTVETKTIVGDEEEYTCETYSEYDGFIPWSDNKKVYLSE